MSERSLKHGSSICSLGILIAMGSTWGWTGAALGLPPDVQIDGDWTDRIYLTCCPTEPGVCGDPCIFPEIPDQTKMPAYGAVFDTGFVMLWGKASSTDTTYLLDPNNCNLSDCPLIPVPSDGALPGGATLHWAGHTYLSEGQLMTSGGTFGGNNNAHQYCAIYDPEAPGEPHGKWTRTDDLRGGFMLDPDPNNPPDIPDPNPLGTRSLGILVLRPDGKATTWAGRFVVDPFFYECTWVEVFNPATGLWEDEDTSQRLVSSDPLGNQMFWWNGIVFAPYGDRSTGNPGAGNYYDSTVIRDHGTPQAPDWKWDHAYISTPPPDGLGGIPDTVSARGGQHTATLLTRDYTNIDQNYMEIMLLGGGSSQLGITPTAEIFRANDPIEPAWRFVHENTVSMVLADIECDPDGPCPYMHNARRQHATTLLPDGRKLITGGTNVSDPLSIGDIVLTTEVFDPNEVYTLTVQGSGGPVQVQFTGSFRALNADVQGKRWYYHVPLLLADGRVLLGGGQAFKNQSENYNEPSLQFYSPWYLFHSPRPAITSVNFTEFPYNDEFTVFYDVNSVVTDIDHVVLMRPSSVANQIDTDQRRLELKFSVTAAGQLCVETPPNDLDAPPGYYMMFILEDRTYASRNLSIPSTAVWVELREGAGSACDVALP